MDDIPFLMILGYDFMGTLGSESRYLRSILAYYKDNGTLRKTSLVPSDRPWLAGEKAKSLISAIVGSGDVETSIGYAIDLQVCRMLEPIHQRNLDVDGISYSDYQRIIQDVIEESGTTGIRWNRQKNEYELRNGPVVPVNSIRPEAATKAGVK